MTDWNKDKPIIGEEYTVHENGKSDTFRAAYLGRLKEKTPWYLQPETPEGHIFLGLSRGHEMQMYNIRTGGIRVEEGNGDELKVWWIGEGDDDTGYPIGFCVNKLKHNFGKLEMKYLENLFNRKNGKLVA